MPGAVDVLQVPDHGGVTGGAFVDDGAAAGSSGAQWSALVRTVVGDGIEGAIDVVDADSVASDRHQFISAGCDFVDGGDGVLAALRQSGPLDFSWHSEHPHLTLENRDGIRQVIGRNAVFEHDRLAGGLG